MRYLGSPGASSAVEGLNRWVGLFASACTRSVGDALQFEARIRAIQAGWREVFGSVRQGSAAEALIASLPGAPIVTVTSASRLIGRSFERTNEAVARLQEGGVVRPITVGRRNRAFEARAVIDAFTDLERQLASPSGHTRMTPPERPTPRRRR